MKNHIGMELGTKNIRCVFLDAEWNIRLRREIPAHIEQGPDAVMRRMSTLINEMCSEINCDKDAISAIGVGAPGPLNSKTGMLHSPPNLKGWERVPHGPRLSVMTSLPVYIDNDANCTGWAEYKFGAGKGCRDMIGMTLGSGVGGSIIIDGDLFAGKDCMAGEIGHIPIERKGRRCVCGSRGCAEAYLTPTAIVNRFRAKTSKGWRSTLSGRGDMAYQDIFLAAAEGDALSLKIVDHVGKCFGVLASIIVNFINPERIVISGHMIQSGGSMLLEAVRRECLSRCFGPNRSVDILPAQLGRDAGVIGAASLAELRKERDAQAQLGAAVQEDDMVLGMAK